MGGRVKRERGLTGPQERLRYQQHLAHWDHSEPFELLGGRGLRSFYDFAAIGKAEGDKAVIQIGGGDRSW